MDVAPCLPCFGMVSLFLGRLNLLLSGINVLALGLLLSWLLLLILMFVGGLGVG